ncbi:hypothetical protein C4564_01095 [Candidatus Microgenomates bacterium]|nr:MAG: hypothetical protein C4564_01095 [Candidatus Microgenomates bacterium]
MLVRIRKHTRKILLSISGFVAFATAAILAYSLWFSYRSVEYKLGFLQILNTQIGEENAQLKDVLEKNIDELEELKNQDQYKINIDLKNKIGNIEKTYVKAVDVYEELLKFKDSGGKASGLEELYTSSLVLLSKQSYEEANTKLSDLSSRISAETTKLVASFTIPASVPVDNTPPGSGYSRQSVNTEIGQYLVSIISADLGTTKVIVDTASSGDCHNDCPVLSLGEYVSRNGASAGVNGSYFCPASYPSCAGKTNSFDTLLMNKNKTYFNSDNNVYSNVPAVVFGSGYIRFLSQSLEWGRDTGIDSMIANQPLLLRDGNVQFSGDSDPKKGSKAGRSFVASKGGQVYIGVVHNSTVAEAAMVLKAMGIENGLNLDSGGSTALWSGGYKVGPGRNIPNAILFVKK